MATERPLYPYIPPSSEVLRCPADKGQEEGTIAPGISGDWKPSKYETLGCSYWYNSFSWDNNTIQTPQSIYFLSEQKENCVTDPVRMILMYEPPAMWYGNYYHWHFARGPTTVDPANLASDGQKFISPILFVDGHSASFDFTHALKDASDYPLEPTRDWYWYEPSNAPAQP